MFGGWPVSGFKVLGDEGSGFRFGDDAFYNLS